MLTFLTSGESHGPQLTGIIEGIPAGLKIDINHINKALANRQSGYGRGARQNIEHDMVEVLGGVRHSVTLGSPISLVIKNKDFNNWKKTMSPVSDFNNQDYIDEVTSPRPGHADLVGGIKYRFYDLRNVLERSSARETAMQVAIGDICEQLLAKIGISIVGYVRQIGKYSVKETSLLNVKDIKDEISKNDLRIIDNKKVDALHKIIDKAKMEGNTLGGVVRVVVENLPAGLGSYVSRSMKLDAQLAAAVVSVNAVKGVSFGLGSDISTRTGRQVLDKIQYDSKSGWTRLSNNLGGLEGGMTNGMPLVINAILKPISTLSKPLKSVDVKTKKIKDASVQRSDVSAIVPASVVVSSVVAIELTKVITETFDCSNMARLQEQLNSYRKEVRDY